MRVATDAAGVALWSWNVDTDEIAMDERAHSLWGVPRGERQVTFEDLSARIHPADFDRVRTAFEATRDMLGAYDLEFRVMHGNAVRWVSARGQGDDLGIIGRVMFGVFLDITDRKQVEETRELLAGEMSHRVKNLFAVASALTSIAARSATTTEGMAQDLTQRLTAVGHAHDLVRPTTGEGNGKAALLADLLGVLLGPYDTTGAVGDRILVGAPDVRVGETSATHRGPDRARAGDQLAQVRRAVRARRLVGRRVRGAAWRGGPGLDRARRSAGRGAGGGRRASGQGWCRAACRASSAARLTVTGGPRAWPSRCGWTRPAWRRSRRVHQAAQHLHHVLHGVGLADVGRGRCASAASRPRRLGAYPDRISTEMSGLRRLAWTATSMPSPRPGMCTSVSRASKPAMPSSSRAASVLSQASVTSKPSVRRMSAVMRRIRPSSSTRRMRVAAKGSFHQDQVLEAQGLRVKAGACMDRRRNWVFFQRTGGSFDPVPRKAGGGAGQQLIFGCPSSRTLVAPVHMMGGRTIELPSLLPGLLWCGVAGAAWLPVPERVGPSAARSRRPGRGAAMSLTSVLVFVVEDEPMIQGALRLALEDGGLPSDDGL